MQRFKSTAHKNTVSLIVRLGSAYEIAGRFMVVKHLVLSKKVNKEKEYFDSECLFVFNACFSLEETNMNLRFAKKQTVQTRQFTNTLVRTCYRSTVFRAPTQMVLCSDAGYFRHPSTIFGCYDQTPGIRGTQVPFSTRVQGRDHLVPCTLYLVPQVCEHA